MNKWIKVAIFAALLIAAGYLFGYVCKQTQQGYELLFSPSTKDAIRLALWLLTALATMALTAGLVAALVRPLWACLITFALSALAMLLAWGLKATSAALTSVYFIASAIYAWEVARGLEERLSFSVRPISENQSTLLTALVIVVCASLYFGYAAHIEEEGFSIPPALVDMVMEMMKEEIGKRVPAAERWETLDKFDEESKRWLEEFEERAIKPYEKFIPLAIALSVFTPLVTITHLLSWIPILVLGAIFPILTALGVTKVVTETREVRRLTIE